MRNEKSGRKAARVAGKVLKAGKATPSQAKTLAGSVLTQSPNRPKPKSGGKKR